MTGSNLTKDFTGPAERAQQRGDSAGLLGPLAGPRVEGLYAHVPFCFHKCHYCDFYSIVDTAGRQDAFVERLAGELAAVGPLVRGPLRTVFVGGGTPTLLTPGQWERLLEAMDEAVGLGSVVEFTVEANPETLTDELAAVLAAGGVNRLSIGAQSFDPRHLKTLERWHEPANVDRAVATARRHGIEDVNLDLIFAIPGQTLDEWRADLDRALSIEPTHLACYGLMYEPNTPLTEKMHQGRFDPAEPEREAMMYEQTIDRLAAAGFEQYEISNFARAASPKPEAASYRCAHNLLYWHNGNWLAVGPSASGHVDGLRWTNAPHLGRYLASSGGSPVDSSERLDADASFGERLMLRLRLTDGVERAWLEPYLDGRRSEAIERLIRDGLLERTAEHVRLTRRGLLLADSAMAELL